MYGFLNNTYAAAVSGRDRAMALQGEVAELEAKVDALSAKLDAILKAVQTGGNG